MQRSWISLGDARRVAVALVSLAACGDDGTSSATASVSSTSSTGTTDGSTTQETPTSGSAATTDSGSGSMSETLAPTGDPTDTTATTGPTTDNTTSQVSVTDTTTGTTGEPCQGAECCEAGQVFCGDVCCAMGEVCNFTKCEMPGAECKEEADCGQDEYCDYALGEPDVKPPDPMCRRQAPHEHEVEAVRRELHALRPERAVQHGGQVAGVTKQRNPVADVERFDERAVERFLSPEETSTSEGSTSAGAACGDGELDAPEECDDGAAVGGDGCAADCRKEYRRVFVTSMVFTGDLCGAPRRRREVPTGCRKRGAA